MPVICIALVLVIGSSAHVQLCYECLDPIDSTCSDRYFGRSEHKTECDDGYGCSKTKSVFMLYGIDITTTTRSCGTGGFNSNCKKPIITSAVGLRRKTWDCSCYTDYCNSGTQLAVSSALITSALAKFML